MINGVREFAEVFFDDVVVPADRMLGEVNGGWAVAMSILPYERSSCFWQRIAYLYRRLRAARRGRAGRRPQRARSSATRSCSCTRCAARSRATQHRLAAGETLGAETSIDKVLVATGEHATYDAVRRLLPGVVETRRRRGGVRCGAASTSTRAPRRSTAAPPRCSATSSPAGCSTSGATSDGRGRARAARGDRRRRARRRATRRRRRACWPSLGWLEMLAAEPDDAIAVVFDALGATNRAATALDDVVVAALGSGAAARPRGAAPAVRHVGGAGQPADGACTRSGSRPARVATARELLVVCAAGSRLAR